MLTEQQIKDRMNYIGGSDVPIIMGLSNYKTPYVLFLEKKGLISSQQTEETDQQYWGKLLEPVVKEHCEKKHNIIIKECNEQIHKDYPFLRGNLDGFIEAWPAVWEGKCSDKFMRHVWGEEGSDVIPMEYLVQIATYCSIMNVEHALLSVLIGGNEYREYHYERNLELESILLESVSKFWDCVQNNIEPECINIDDLRIKYKKSNPEKSILINKDVAQQLTQLSEIKFKIKELNELEQEAKFNIMDFMKDSECLTDENNKPLVSWKANIKGNRTFLLK